MKPTFAISVLVAAAGTASAQFVTSITPAVAARNGDDGGVLDRRQGAVTTVLRTITKTSTRQSTSTAPLSESRDSFSPGSSTASAADTTITTSATQINTDSGSSSITSSSPTLTSSSNTLTTSSSTETTAASTRVPEPQTGGGDKISSGTAAGIAAGVVGGVLAFVGVFMIAYHKRQKVQNGTVVTADYPHSLGDQKPPIGGVPSRSNTDMFFPPPAARYPIRSRSNTDRFFPPPAALAAYPAPARNDAESSGKGKGGSEMTLGANDLAYDTERSGQDAGYSPQSGHEMGYSPRGGQEVGYSPRSGQEMGQSPRGDQEMGYSPRGGQEMGYSPRGGQGIVSSPRSGQDMGYSPRGGQDIVVSSPRSGQDMGYSPRSGPVASPGYQNHHAVSTDVPMPAANPASNASGQAVAYPPKGDNFSLPAFMIPGGERARSASFGSPEADPSSSPPPPVPRVGRALATGNESPLERNEVELP